MPASLVHMLIAREVRKSLMETPETRKFAEEVLDRYPKYMELGSMGPDLPYYESMAKGALDLLLKRSDKPMGVDQWSYQLHSKDPNLFPLKMLEVTWKETDMEKEDWEEDDRMKFAFVCGFLTHMAADQIIHPMVNIIAGPYYKRGQAREKHRECEIYQDLHIFGQTGDNFGEQKFNQWCDLNPGWGDNTTVWFRYFLQKSFIEAHAVAPTEDNLEDWVDGTLTILRGLNSIGPYPKALGDLGAESPRYQEYILLKPPSDTSPERLEDYEHLKDLTYDDFYKDAVELAGVYVRAAGKIYDSDELDDDLRKKFQKVVRNADLSAPLEKNILRKAKAALKDW